ncbi:MAG: ATP synthase F1 subunit epsilon [Polyangiaceae bacterium]
MATDDVRSDKIHLEIVTPKGRALDTSVDEVTAPSVGGEFGVMPGHVPVLVALRTGIVSYRQGSETTKVAVGTGFAEAGANRLLILTDEFVERSSVDPVLVRKELAEVDAQIPLVDPTAPGAEQEELKEKRNVLIQRQNWLAAQLELYGDPPPPTLRPYEEYGPTPLPEDEDAARHEAAES